MKSSQVPLLLAVIVASKSKWLVKSHKENDSQEANVNCDNSDSSKTRSKHHTTSFEKFSRMMQTRNVTQRLLRRFPFGQTNSLIYLNEMPSFVKTDLVHAAILKMRASEPHVKLEKCKQEHSITHLNRTEVMNDITTSHKDSKINISTVSEETKRVNKLYSLYNTYLYELMRLNAPRAEVAHAALQHFLHRERNRARLMSTYKDMNKENAPSKICEPLLALPITENESAAIGLCLQPHCSVKLTEKQQKKISTESEGVQHAVINNKTKSLQNALSCTICVNTFLSSPRVDYRVLPQLYLLVLPVRTPHHLCNDNYTLDYVTKNYEILRKRAITQFVQSRLVYDTSSQQLVLRNVTSMERKELKTKMLNKNNENQPNKITSCVDINEEEVLLVQGYSLSPNEAVQAAMALIKQIESHKQEIETDNTSELSFSEWQYHLIFLCPSSAASVHSVLSVNNNNNSVTDPPSAVPLSELATLYPSLFVNYHIDIPAPSQQAIHNVYNANNNNNDNNNKEGSHISRKFMASVDSAIPLPMKKLRFTTPITKERYDSSITLRATKSENSSNVFEYKEEESHNVPLLNLENHSSHLHDQGNTHLWANQSRAQRALSTVNEERLSTFSIKGEVYSSRNAEMNELQMSFAHSQEKLVRAHLLSHNNNTIHYTSTDSNCITTAHNGRCNDDTLAVHGAKHMEQTSEAAVLTTKQADHNEIEFAEGSHEGITSLDANRIAFVPFTVAEVKVPYAQMQLALISGKQERKEEQLPLSNGKDSNISRKQAKRKNATNASKRVIKFEKSFDKSSYLPMCLQAIEQRKIHLSCTNESLLAPRLWKCLNKTALFMWSERDKQQKEQEVSEQIIPLGLESIIDAREHVVLPFLRKTRKLPLSYFRDTTKECYEQKNDRVNNDCSEFVPMLWTLSEINTLLGWTRYASLFEEQYGLLRHLLSTDVYTLIGAAHHSIYTECITQEPFLLIHDMVFVQKVLLPAMCAFHAHCRTHANANKYTRQMQYVCYRHQGNLERWYNMTLIEEENKNDSTNKAKETNTVSSQQQQQQQQQQPRKVPWQAKTFIRAMIAKRNERKGIKTRKESNKMKKKEKVRKNVKSYCGNHNNNNMPELCVIPIMPFLEWATLHPSEWSHDVSKMLPPSVNKKMYTKDSCNSWTVSSEMTNQDKRNSFYSYKDMMRVMHYLLCYEDLFCIVGNDGTTVAFFKEV